MITHTYDPDREAILSPTFFAAAVEGFPSVAVVSFNDRDMDVLNARFSPERIGAMRAGGDVPIYKVTFGGRDMAVYRTSLGGSAAVGLLEEMIAKGCKKFVFFGSCGTLNKDLAAKSLIIPTAAYRDEGVSYHYAPPSDYIEVKTAPRLAEILTELNLPHICGKTWTTDAFYRETRRNMEARKAEGCLTVEMECASVMAAGQFRGVDVYQFLYAADCLGGDEWDARVLGSLPTEQRERYLRVALEAAARV